MESVPTHPEVPTPDDDALAGAPAPDAAEDPALHVGTRNRVARSILANGPSTAVDLGKRLEMTPAGVRRHLDALLAEKLVEAREQRTYGQRGRGRPAKVFALTDRGRGVFYQAYDQLAVDALRFLQEHAGDQAVEAFARRRVAELEERHRDELAAADPERRPALLAAILTEEGYAANVREGGTALGARRAAVPAPLPGRPRRRGVPAAVRGRDRGVRRTAGHPRPAARHHRPRRRRLHHLHSQSHQIHPADTTTDPARDRRDPGNAS